MVKRFSRKRLYRLSPLRFSGDKRKVNLVGAKQKKPCGNSRQSRKGDATGLRSFLTVHRAQKATDMFFECCAGVGGCC